jgi:signal transduction histidine kinase
MGGPDYPASSWRSAVVLTAVCAIAGLTVQRLLAENAAESMRDALRRVVAAQEVERRRIARELHDETGQALTSIMLGLKAVEELVPAGEPRAAVADLGGRVATTMQDVRRLALELRPKVLDDYGLVPALERLTSTFNDTTGIVVDFETGLTPDTRLTSEIETALYRIVQESLTNMVKHAEPEHASILLSRKSDGLVLVIEDDGRGFDTATRGHDGLGLEGMRERMNLLDGRLAVESSLGYGTTVVAEVPL